MLQLITDPRNRSKHSLLIEMNRMVASVLGDETPGVSKRLAAMEEEVAVMKGKVAGLEGANADLRKETRDLKEEVKYLTDWSNDFDQWGKLTHANVQRLVKKKAAET
jgi:hypothetical protein